MPELLDPGVLFGLAERRTWAASVIALERDREQWLALPRGTRERLGWQLASFFVGEERVAVTLGPLLAAHGSADEAAFVASQQLDEARHAWFFDRFHREVVGLEGGFADRLEAARAAVGAPVIELFDGRLVDAARCLADDPCDPAAKIEFVVLYHMVIEGTLALAGQRMLLEHLGSLDLMPGLRRALALIEQDEHRHIAYGTWVLHQHTAEPELRARIECALAEFAPLAAAVLVPPGARPERFRPFGWSGAELQAWAFGALARRMRTIGIEAPEHVAA